MSQTIWNGEAGIRLTLRDAAEDTYIENLLDEDFFQRKQSYDDTLRQAFVAGWNAAYETESRLID